MSFSSQLPLRLDKETDVRLGRLAKSIGTTKSGIIRMLAQTFVEQCIDKHGRVTLPPDWQRHLPERDERSK